MRVIAHTLVLGLLAASAGVLHWGAVTAQQQDPATILAAARQALGGEKKLSAVKSFTATGRTRQVRGDNLVPIEFEISVELPDKYLRKDEIPAQESGPTASGFNGDELLQDPPPPAPPAAAPGRPGGPGPGPGANPADAMRKVRVTTLKQDFARLTLGMFAASFPSYPLTFTYVGEAEAPQGKADVIDAKGGNNFTIRLFVSKDTHLPIMVSWQGAAGRGGPGPGGRGGVPGMAGAPPAGAPPAGAPPAGPPPAGPPPAGAPPAGAPPAGAPPAGAPPAAAAPPGMPQRGAPPAGAPPAGERGGRPAASPPVENRLYFADYRDVDGMQFPFRLRRAVGADTIEETTFDRFKVNPKIDPKKFEIKK
jgi:hypothetical protein